MISKIIYILKNIIAHALYYSGSLFFYQKTLLGNKIFVLTYHRVLPPHQRVNSFSHDAIIVNPEYFEKHLTYLKKHFQVISLNEFNSIVSGSQPLKKQACLVTFDDGWKDNYDHAFPILKNYDIPAVIFLPYNYIGKDKPFWQEHLGFLLYTLYLNKDKYANLLAKYQLNSMADVPADQIKFQIINRYIDYYRRQPYETLFSMINEIEDVLTRDNLLDISNNNDCYISWENIKQMENNNIDFGSHSLKHQILTRLSEAEYNTEISQSKNLLEETLGKSITAFAYPNGDFNDAISHCVQEHGYKAAFSTVEGPFTLGENPFEIKRKHVQASLTKNEPMFLCRILGIF